MLRDTVHIYAVAIHRMPADSLSVERDGEEE